MRTRPPAPCSTPRDRRRRFLLPAGGDHPRGALAPCASRCRTATSRSCLPNAASNSTTSPSTDGCSGLPAAGRGARPCRQAIGDRWQVDETYGGSPVGGAPFPARSTSPDRSSTCSCPRVATQGRPSLLERAIGTTAIIPVVVVTDQAVGYRAVLGELLPAAWHCTEQYANNRVEADHGRFKRGGV
jgi:DDE domain